MPAATKSFSVIRFVSLAEMSAMGTASLAAAPAFESGVSWVIR